MLRQRVKWKGALTDPLQSSIVRLAEGSNGCGDVLMLLFICIRAPMLHLVRYWSPPRIGTRHALLPDTRPPLLLLLPWIQTPAPLRPTMATLGPCRESVAPLLCREPVTVVRRMKAAGVKVGATQCSLADSWTVGHYGGRSVALPLMVKGTP